MKGLPGLVLGVAAALVVACSAGSRQAAAPTHPAPSQHDAAPMMPPSQDPHAQIQLYSDQIESQRKQLGMPEAVLPMATQPTASSPLHAQQDPACHAGDSETCTNMCTLSNSICDNADKICKISDDLGNDEWAAGKCASARATCSDAHKRCCACT